MLGSYSLFVVAGSGDASTRRRVSLRIGRVPIVDTVSDAQLGFAEIRRERGALVVTVPNVTEAGDCYIKVARTLPNFWVFDRFGWQPVA
jgi:hypothetical protein